MRLSDFSYHLPDHLIARYPTEKRSESRLLQVSEDKLYHRQFTDIVDLIDANDLLVFNNTKVIPARLYGQKISGGKLEILIERIFKQNQALAHIKASKAPKAGSDIQLEDDTMIKVTGRDGALFILEFTEPVMQVLERTGHIPLPPYMAREDENLDVSRYQTVYAKHQGSVAAPTAGLHFDEPILNSLKQKGVEFAYVTLHVGAGTFQPVRVDNIEDHQMHAEYVEVPEATCNAIADARARGGRVIAVGTTSVRSLESAAAESATQGQPIAPYYNDTKLFIYPGYRFLCVDAMLTNFHLPESSLLMLVSAFSGRETIMAAYEEAINKDYRFFSYGDCMFLTPAKT